jgi:outer membrane protein OmpA-like peptidoglycan-associated protein
MSTYGGALLTVEGHSDPSNFERKKEKGATQLVLSRIRQAAKNLSLSRANAFRSSLISYAKAKGIAIDPSQIVAIGHGVNNPVYARPKTKQQWAANRRIEFRIVNVEAESDVFVPFE